MKRPRVTTVMISSYCALAVLVGGIAYMGLEALISTNAATRDIAENGVRKIVLSEKISLDMANLQIAYRDHAITLSATDKLGVERVVTGTVAALQQDIISYRALAATDDEMRRVEEIQASLTRYQAVAGQLLDQSRNNRMREARGEMAKMVPLGTAIAAAAAELATISQSGVKHAYGMSQTRFEITLRNLLAAGALSGVVVIGAICFVAMGIAKPIRRIAARMKSLAGGDIVSDIPYAGRSDEIGEMASAVLTFRQTAIARNEQEVEMQAVRDREEALRRNVERQAEAAATKRLVFATAGFADGLRRLASGDLAFQLEHRFSDEFEPLRHDFNRSIAQLNFTLTEISHTITMVEASAREIAGGAHDLSRRTEQQAASLEEAAAALTQVTGKVTDSTLQTEDAKVLATEANGSALQSAAVVENAESAFRQIQDSARQIGSIITVIDEIAYQTNLLALNAGVEAARAGHAGKGFAVVAHEVRELAQRSANAAKDIKGLIKNSSSRVESGARHLADVGNSLATITRLIVSVDGCMELISTSAKEQASGLSEINSAVSALDRATQQNAALVEESTEGSNALAEEAKRLRDLVGRFRLGDLEDVDNSAINGSGTLLAIRA